MCEIVVMMAAAVAIIAATWLLLRRKKQPDASGEHHRQNIDLNESKEPQLEVGEKPVCDAPVGFCRLSRSHTRRRTRYSPYLNDQLDVHVVQTLTFSLGMTAEQPHAQHHSMATVCRLSRNVLFPPQFRTLQEWFHYAFANSEIDDVYVIADTSAPMFDLNLPLYPQQLNEDLGLNIYIDRKSGSYQRLPLDKCATCMGEYHDSRRSFQLQVAGGKFGPRQYQGDEKMDTDLPTYLEAKLFYNTFGKLCWMLLQPFVYALCPVITYPRSPTKLEIVNVIVQLAFDTLVYYLCGGKVSVYMIVGSLLAMGLHPVAGHFILEHYMFQKGCETYSYYGCLNWITFSVGYHKEHHDFPAVPGSKLPEVQRIATEYYDNLPQHNSWVTVLYNFVMDPDIGPYAHIKRKNRGLKS